MNSATAPRKFNVLLAVLDDLTAEAADTFVRGVVIEVSDLDIFVFLLGAI